MNDAAFVNCAMAALADEVSQFVPERLEVGDFAVYLLQMLAGGGELSVDRA
jgi:hypothetical protein